MKRSLILICTIFLLTIVLFSLQAFASADVKPGLNVFTGTEAAFDFEGDTSNVVFCDSSDQPASVYTDDNEKTVNSVVVRTKGSNTENHAASVDGNKYYFYIDCEFPVIDKDRPVKVSYDYILGIGGNQIRTLINYPTTYNAPKIEKASFNIVYLSPAMTTETWRNVTHTQTPGTACSTGSTYYRGGENMEFISFVNYSGNAQASYFDNLLCIPYYKVSYDLNGGEGTVADEYFLQSSGTNYTLKATAPDIYKNGYTFVGWANTPDATAEDVITAFTVTPGSDITVFAVWEEDATAPKKYLVELYDGSTLRLSQIATEGKYVSLPSGEYKNNAFLLGWKTSDGSVLHSYKFIPTSSVKLYSVFGDRTTTPGINMVANGTFEQGGVFDLKPSNGTLEIVNESGNNVLKYSRNSNYASIQHHITWESGRKYRISYKIKAPASIVSCGNIVYTDDTGSTSHLFQKSITKDEWATHEITYTFDDYTYSYQNSDALSLFANPLGNVDNIVYYDDIQLIPYYKVTYNAMGGKGSVPETAYFLDGTYTVDTQTKPTKEGYTFLGWALSEGGINAVTQISPTPGKDISLYAIWENEAVLNAITYDFENDKRGNANGTISVVLSGEIANHTSAQVLLANDDGILDGYTHFGNMTISDGIATYSVSGDRAFPFEATRLAIKFTGENLNDVYYWYTIPGEKRLLSAEPVYTYWAVSDLHLNGVDYDTDYWPSMSVTRRYAINDIMKSDADFAFINGDLICYSEPNYIAVLETYFRDILNNPDFNTNGIPFFISSGNHEYHKLYPETNTVVQLTNTYNTQLDYLEENFGETFNITRGGDDCMWYAVDNDLINMVVLQTPEPDETNIVSNRQLQFLDTQLYIGEKSGKTNMVLTHIPLQKTVPYKDQGYYSGLVNTDAVNAILAKHPNTIVFSSHTHSDLTVDNVHFTAVNNMTTTPSYVNTGSIVNTAAWNGGVDGSGYHKDFSTGVFVEVYNDFILIKSRKFMEDSLYFGHGVYMIELPQRGMADTYTVGMNGIAVNGETFTALVNGTTPPTEAGYTYEWIVGKNVVGTDAAYTADVKRYFHQQNLILRVTFPDGSYASIASADVFDVPNADNYVTDVIMTIGDSTETDLYYADFEKYVGECTLIAAAYAENGRLVGTDIILLSDDEDGIITVNVAKSLESTRVKVFAFDDFESFIPITKEAVSEGNLIINGNAECDNEQAFFSSNATISIVEDAEKGKVWQAVPNEGTQYTYIRQNFQYVPGATYKMTMDVKLVEANGSDDISAWINSNTIYSSADHNQSMTNLNAGEWKKVEYTFILPEETVPSSNDQFSVYCTPVIINGTSYGATFRIANVEVHLYSK